MRPPAHLSPGAFCAPWRVTWVFDTRPTHSYETCWWCVVYSSGSFPDIVSVNFQTALFFPDIVSVTCSAVIADFPER